MKSVFVAGSRKFYSEIERLVEKLQKEGIRAQVAGKQRGPEKDTPASEKKALLSAFRRIDGSDFLYVYAKDGYVGKAVAMEIAYAYARKKPVVSSEEITELSAGALVSKVITPSRLSRVLVSS
jgi:hypothetical protein